MSHAVRGEIEAALDGLGEVRILCAHRRGSFGVARWNWQVEEWLAAAGRRVDGSYPGRPVMVTTNDPVNGLFNGDLGVVVHGAKGLAVAFPEPGGPRLLGAVAHRRG